MTVCYINLLFTYLLCFTYSIWAALLLLLLLLSTLVVGSSHIRHYDITFFLYSSSVLHVVGLLSGKASSWQPQRFSKRHVCTFSLWDTALAAATERIKSVKQIRWKRETAVNEVMLVIQQACNAITKIHKIWSNTGDIQSAGTAGIQSSLPSATSTDAIQCENERHVTV